MMNPVKELSCFKCNNSYISKEAFLRDQLHISLLILSEFLSELINLYFPETMILGGMEFIYSLRFAKY